MTKIQRYQFQIEPEFELEMPRNSRVLSVQLHNGSPVLWAHIRPENEKFPVKFRCFSTDSNIPDDPVLIYVGTLQVSGGMIAWHVFMVENLVSFTQFYCEDKISA